MSYTWPETRRAFRRLQYSIRAVWAVWLCARLFDVLLKMGCHREALLAFSVMETIPLPSKENQE